MKSKVFQQIPQDALDLTKYSGNDIINMLGKSIITDVVSSILCGGNVRNITEKLTQRRILKISAAIFITYLRANKLFPNIEKELTSILKNEIYGTSKLNDKAKIFLSWFLGITGKSTQNVIRDENGFVLYLKQLNEAFAEVSNDVKNNYGDISVDVSLKTEKTKLSWDALLQIFFAIGTQTLAIRGSEKSMYGKMFERLTLGSLLSILGFELVDKTDTKKNGKIFWLSERENKRESDATIIVKPGVGIRIDIGFIGTGNTEISLDKVSRFERNMEFGNNKHYVSTLIIVDKIGDGSRIKEMAKEVDGDIIQMSMAYWVFSVAKIIKERTGFVPGILKIRQEDSLTYIRKAMERIDISNFLNTTRKKK